MKGYLSADLPRKYQYYGVRAGAAAACEPNVFDPDLDNAKNNETIANAALNVVQRELQAVADKDHVAALITDAYAIGAVGYLSLIPRAAIFQADRRGEEDAHRGVFAESVVDEDGSRSA